MPLDQTFPRRPVARIDLKQPVHPAPGPTLPVQARVGLFGGSFNPAHAGHLHASQEALRRLGLDRVVWLVSPQNPLKERRGMAPFSERFASARQVAQADPRIEVSDYEERHGLQYSADTVARLNRRGNRRYVWLIGADNLLQLPRWKHWLRLLHACPVAVLARAPYLERAGTGLVARRFAAARIDERQAHRLVDLPAPAWVLLHHRLHPASSTAIRGERKAASQENFT
ncbi:nicotinate (nicotinamide) nucleotide adenylyltransferase [Geminicoccus flavidas]|uniref:nicotinate (nicotinamide) nucleotide adenylyltransferase n=1 Tax=Geminicoccus flavidas TaxID=2506407 RepID=UPI00135CD15A|nr:nicotinate (nicotinamide) nucleotide adenylyltransferase [Geminicoccus flavidas]